MRLPSSRDGRNAAGSHAGHGGDDAPLTGSWAAVRWEYARPDGSVRVDVIADRGDAVTLSISAGDYVLSHAPREEGARSAAGALRAREGSCLEFAPRVGEAERVEFRLVDGTLVLRSESSAWDFSGAGAERASFTAVLVPL